MDVALRARLELLEELVREMYRHDVLTDDMIERVAERLGEKALHASPSEAELAEHAAHMATMIPFEAVAQTQVEFQAERSDKRANERRSRLHVITSDGGNPGT